MPQIVPNTRYEAERDAMTPQAVSRGAASWPSSLRLPDCVEAMPMQLMPAPAATGGGCEQA
eukprot:CAMPEP_0198546404 /NCGR_PEP_ID=MMETSP1462-20131121/66996_1 /TAXON_ID=1333877 /ORGANISM="Brandtodinium nutriculum, Strain RCC3387" /LENGTH=60 /DNA_ID=CAMNT_0044276849 /DNA_START=37 /DNA_END=219 /DNA_ORIENTATION=+